MVSIGGRIFHELAGASLSRARGWKRKSLQSQNAFWIYSGRAAQPAAGEKMSAEKPETMDAALDRGSGSAAMTPTSSEASWLEQSHSSINAFRNHDRGH